MNLYDAICPGDGERISPRGWTQKERLRVHRMMALIGRIWEDAKEFPLQSEDPFDDATAQAMDGLACEFLDLACRVASPEWLASHGLDEVER